jgi:type IV secretory pathway VirB4 component
MSPPPPPSKRLCTTLYNLKKSQLSMTKNVIAIKRVKVMNEQLAHYQVSFLIYNLTSVIFCDHSVSVCKLN